MIIISAIKETYTQPDPSGQGAPDTTEERMQIRFVVNSAIYKAPFPVPQVVYSSWTDADWEAHIKAMWPNITREINGYPQYMENPVDLIEALLKGIQAILKLSATQQKNLTYNQTLIYLKNNLLI